MLEELTARFRNVRVDTFDGLTVDYATKVKAHAVLRGIRALSDYEYELQMALMNRKLQPDLETVFMMPAEQIFLCQLAPGARGRAPRWLRRRTRAGDGGATPERSWILPLSFRTTEERRRENDERSNAASHRSEIDRSINRIEPSATMAVVAEADKLRQQGIDVVDFGAGEPHFSTPQHIKDAAILAIQNNFTKYTAVGGTAELRDAIVHRHAVDFDSDYRREEAIASTGGKHALFNAYRFWSTTAMSHSPVVLGLVQRHRPLRRRELRAA